MFIGFFAVAQMRQTLESRRVSGIAANTSEMWIIVIIRIIA